MGETIDVKISAAASVARAKAATSNQVGYCLANVAAWLGWPPVHGEDASLAVDVWQYAEDRHPGDMSPPVGTVVVLGAVASPRWPGDTNYAAGDVALVVGPGGRLRATDYPRAGVVGDCTLAQRIAQTRRPYLGWVGDYYGNPIDYDHTGAPASAVAAAAAGEEDEVSYSIIPDAQSKTIYACSTSTGLRTPIQTPAHVTLLQRYKANAGSDKMLLAELDIVAAYLRQINPAPAVTATVDQASIAAQIVAALKKLTGKVSFA